MPRNYFPGARKPPRSRRSKKGVSKRLRRLTHYKVFDPEELALEVWKEVSYDPRYSVSTLGRLRGPRGLLRTPACKKRKYEYTTILGKQYAVHRLVLEAFVGTCPEGYEACHYDDDPTNNRLTNLRWDTHESNIMDKIRNGNARGRHRSLSEADCLRLAQLRESGMKLKELSRLFSISEGYVSKLARRFLH